MSISDTTAGAVHTPVDQVLPVVLPVVGDKVLVFALADVKRLRLLGVLGILTGTLPKAPQQNVFLGLPLQLSLYEVIWLVENGQAVLVDNLSYNQWAVSQRQLGPKEANKQNRIILEASENSKLTEEQQRLKTARLLTLERTANFVLTPDSTESSSEVPSEVKISINDFLEKQLVSEDPDRLVANYHVYRSVKNAGFCLMPGMRFGGEFIGYPGDPLRYHSHLILNCITCTRPTVDLYDLITGGRLATAVKKVWVISGEGPKTGMEGPEKGQDEDLMGKFVRKSEQQAYSIEWAGFG